MANQPNVRMVWAASYDAYCASDHFQSDVQRKASLAILNCKSGKLGYNVSRCDDCGHLEFHNNSCRNRNCPNCQAVKKELWVDERSAEVIDAPYYHVVFTLPHQLNPLLLANQSLLYGLLHKCCAETLLELCADRKYLGAQPGIIQVLHTWNQELDYHVHVHCIVSGGGITPDQKLRIAKGKFFIPVHVLRDKFRGKYLFWLEKYHADGKLVIPESVRALSVPAEWNVFRDRLYRTQWCPFIKQTFNGFGNAIEYLGRYTHKIAISNGRLISVSGEETSFWARGKKPGDPKRVVTLDNLEFIRRFLLHVLPPGFQKIRYYGFLNNRMRKKKLKLIFKLQGHQSFKRRYAGMSMSELLKAVWKVDVCLCPACGHSAMKQLGKTYLPASG